MNHVPYYLNQILMYGHVLDLKEEISALGVRVWISLQTQEGEHGHSVLLHDRRALELLAFYEAHMQMLPQEPFTLSINGHVRSRPDEVQLLGDAVTFHVGPQVRMWGGKLVKALLREYAQQYGHRPWLGSTILEGSNHIATAPAAADSVVEKKSARKSKRQPYNSQNIPLKTGSDG